MNNGFRGIDFKVCFLTFFKGFRALLFIGVTMGFMAAVSYAQSVYTPYAFTNFAGLPGAVGTVDGAGTNAQFDSPQGVATDAAGNVYVSDTLNHTIRKI